MSRGRAGAAALALTGALHASIVPQYETTSVLLGAGAVVAVVVACATAWTIWPEPTPGAWAVAAVLGVALTGALVAAHHGDLGDALVRPGPRDGAAALASAVVVVVAVDGLRCWARERRGGRVGRPGHPGRDAGGGDRRGAVDRAPRT